MLETVGILKKDVLLYIWFVNLKLYNRIVVYIIYMRLF